MFGLKWKWIPASSMSEADGVRRSLKVVGLTSELWLLSLGLARVAVTSAKLASSGFLSQPPYRLPDSSPLCPRRTRFQSNHNKSLRNNE